MFVIGFPLLLIPLAIYNIIAFLMPGVGWGDALTHVRVMSGADWTMSAGDMLVALSLLLLFVELLKATRVGGKTIVDHGLSLLLFFGAGAEFLLVRRAATAPFFILLLMSFLELVGGLAVRRRSSASVPMVEDIKHPDDVKAAEEAQQATV